MGLICRNTKVIELKEGILEHYDYEAVNKRIYSYLKLWYDIDYEVVRFLKIDNSFGKNVYLELYPGNFKS